MVWRGRKIEADCSAPVVALCRARGLWSSEGADEDEEGGLELLTLLVVVVVVVVDDEDWDGVARNAVGRCGEDCWCDKEEYG
jgi:hypothetical protein